MTRPLPPSQTEVPEGAVSHAKHPRASRVEDGGPGTFLSQNPPRSLSQWWVGGLAFRQNLTSSQDGGHGTATLKLPDPAALRHEMLSLCEGMSNGGAAADWREALPALLNARMYVRPSNTMDVRSKLRSLLNSPVKAKGSRKSGGRAYAGVGVSARQPQSLETKLPRDRQAPSPQRVQARATLYCQVVEELSCGSG